MKPYKFEQANIAFAVDQDEYLTLPAFLDVNDHFGRVISCWQPSFLERLQILFTGKVWVSQLTFNQRLQPQRVDAQSPFMTDPTDI